jgi:hypothetical protein
MERKAHWLGRGSKPVRKDACVAAVDFMRSVRQSFPDLALPGVAPSALGGVALMWKISDNHLMVRIESSDLEKIYFQKEGPRNDEEDAVTTSKDVLKRMEHIQRLPRDS